jgi:hypothetical protein
MMGVKFEKPWAAREKAAARVRRQDFVCTSVLAARIFTTAVPVR